MEQSSEAFYSSPVTHEYPDPENYAPNATSYSWEGEDHGYVPPGLPGRSSRSWNDSGRNGWLESSIASLYGRVDGPHWLQGETTLDPDYQVSDAATT